ncbi:DUF6477 family protein [Sulfitobacter donghicola]|uniref:Uncharacterized protein n=1 Tax=Sulfitobacter donghicola DSW-25 = KCTC 12864 = JCM 14565 TaxID=1300350 RepID=A0A073IFX8_9RHOB|nr:DUF6477 family protein [Sulfitobacter donghicola]KEJ88401.1 hypothetical protein DSW25_14985 [Sulfitobacter donghicola DSW-25 = KCTC 12864 = JCM 14565]KIN69733.1 hypothetical protein Z948_3482 [Sulfitobacter donghicola DSW-25 = KCTC 12864 = JCM 14565]
MQDIHRILASLHRPRLLMRAARIGAEDYRRTGHLPRLLGYGVLPRHGDALMKLIGIEAELEDQRTGLDAAYSLVRHVDVLIAIVGEAKMLRATHTGPQLV